MEISHRKFLILMTLWAFCFQLSAGFVRSQCLENQQSLLTKFKENLTFNSTLSTKLVSWNSSTDCCSWFGVTCSNGGNVIGLDLSSEFISGVIDNSSSLYDLHHLRSLDLSSIFIKKTPIPSGFEKLINLHHLNLSYSYSTGHIMFVRNLTRLTELDLSGINLSVEGRGWCGALSSLTRLKVLNLAGCDLIGPIDSSLVQLKSLSVVTLSGNRNLSGPIPEYFGNFLNLTSLDLSGCGLYGKFPEMIFHLPHLQILDLSFSDGLQGSIPEFLENESLQTLWLRGTSFGGNLPESIGNLERLSSIDLFNCTFEGPIPDTMANLTHLVYLDLSFNNFSGCMPSFSSAKNLTYLDLGDNHLSGSILSTNWSGLGKLESIILSYNSLNGAIPASLFEIQSMRSIILSQNQFTRILNEPSNLASSTVEEIILRGNKLAGPFPMFFSQLRSLHTLWISSNNFSGPVNLSSYQQLKNLSELDLSYNSLSVYETGVDPDSFLQISEILLVSCNLTRIPSFLKGNPYIDNLGLSNNQIGGEVPDWIWSLQSLDALNLSHNSLLNLQAPPKGFNRLLALLDLSNNKLQGELPKLPPSADYVDYSSNNFSSVIPVSIVFPLELIYLSLSNNNLYGNIPQTICNATSLSVLNLSNNSLSGAIPQCLFGMKSIGVLNLRGNYLSGNIPYTFPSNCKLETVDLHGNELEGKIPISLAKCGRLEVLDLGSNQISDAFPSHLRNISSLRVLVLRSNKLHGPINCLDGNSSWPWLQIVDLAFNHFSGELPVQCLRNSKGMMYEKNEVLDIHHNNNSLYFYRDTITVTMKGLDVQLVKILTIFTSIDFSSNVFEGKIPDEIGEFHALYVLNLSHNALTGSIPSFMGNLRQLESMDLSSNNLIGTIPQELVNLNFLEVLDLSKNHLEGRIPISTQIQSFSNASFQGNDGLCGLPLTKSCRDGNDSCGLHLEKDCRANAQPWSLHDKHSDDGSHIDWKFLSVELGFVFGLGIVILPLMIWSRWRIWYYIHVDVLLSRLLPQLNQGSRNTKRSRIKTQLKERNKMAGEVALQRPQVSRLRTGRRTVVVV